MTLNAGDAAIVTRQLGREARGAQAVAWRCPCGAPGVVQTAPRLPTGVPFPTMYYLTCRNATRRLSTLEGCGMMADMSERLGSDAELARRYRAAHESYVAARVAFGAELGVAVPEIAGVSAGGMPDRVKCLHALVAHALAAGVGVNPLGDEAVAALGDFWATPCVRDVAATGEV